MLKFHIIIIKLCIFTNKNSQSDTFFPKFKTTIVKIDIKSFSVYTYTHILRILSSALKFSLCGPIKFYQNSI